MAPSSTPFESRLRLFCQASVVYFARFSLFLIYFWFGCLKILDLSPATPLVLDLFNKTLAPLMSFDVFMPAFGLFECLIGILFLIPRLEKPAAALTLIHLFTTAGPLILLPSHTWQGFMVPTMEAQYILKNFLIIVSVMVVLGFRKNPSS